MSNCPRLTVPRLYVRTPKYSTKYNLLQSLLSFALTATQKITALSLTDMRNLNRPIHHTFLSETLFIYGITESKITRY